ncbi:37S ribosomal [Hyphodiscus hymeniophilus]|uniref:37S ribosomal protein S25, mitochondrial n=1 Tax=Hyphodiscus hymeniophilus TaxID=353542 RepID=A0A9P6VQF4_9HELO|nr:37S ribosomal [Hyphodiscus hymeniophilus]
MRGLNLKPSRVYQTASLLLESNTISQPPPWFKTIGSIPPSEILTRTQPTQHRVPNSKPRTRKPSKMFKPQQIEYEEDRLRREFYGDHPWELARPRVVLENDGKDGQRCDWSRIQQPGRPLNGESVVQRQLWLMYKAGMTQAQAYDISRKEFYALRQEEEVERRVAKEEALWVGAYFGKSVLEVGAELEDKTYESWKAWATKEIEAIERQRDAAYTGVGTSNEDEPSESGVADPEEEAKTA